ncbi:MAG: serine--tRNA ligase [Candidatus Ratteibacteria bacterium]|jgi:seryl-tRNA synthetase
MLDIKFIRENSQVVEKAARDKGATVDIAAILALDEERRLILSEAEQLRHQRNETSERISQLKKENKDAAGLILEMRSVSDRIKELEEGLRKKEADLEQTLSFVPNVPAADVPEGKNAEGNVEARAWGEKIVPAFPLLPHHELAEKLGLINFKAAGRMSGSFFVLYTGWGARLERALINFMLDRHRKEGYREVSPPFVVNRRSMYNTGQLPKLEKDMYRVESEDLFLIPTAEVPVTNIHQDELFREADLPVYYTAYTPCFRLEAGAYGKDTKGLLRIHQFDKVEMVKFCRAEDSYAELEKLLADAEGVLQALGLHYRVMLLCTGELSFSGAKCYDIEAWAPAQNRYLEVSSCSNFEDFQARRGNIRYRNKKGEVRFVHTLNGSGVALARTVACILETYQQKDGTIVVPEVLRPYLDNTAVIS